MTRFRILKSCHRDDKELLRSQVEIILWLIRCNEIKIFNSLIPTEAQYLPLNINKKKKKFNHLPEIEEKRRKPILQKWFDLVYIHLIRLAAAHGCQSHSQPTNRANWSNLARVVWVDVGLCTRSSGSRRAHFRLPSRRIPGVGVEYT